MLLIGISHKTADDRQGYAADLWQGSVDDDPLLDRDGDRVRSQLQVAKYYDIPYVSVVDAFGPFLTENIAEWFYHVYRSDNCCHITKTGHKIMANLIVNMINEHKLSRQFQLMNDVLDITSESIYQFQSLKRPTNDFPKALYWNETTLSSFLAYTPLFIDFLQDYSFRYQFNGVADPSWAIIEDVPRKRGI